jgi:hypothetical protein
MQEAVKRRPYVRPRLQVYGPLREVTLSNVSMNMNDPGNGSQSMT